jgi:DNA-binding NtrC family response regulator
MTTSAQSGEFDLRSGNHVILMADDEELMREVLSLMIEENGCEVIAAIDGQHAVELFNQNRERVSCVVLDFSMPGLNGFEAFKQIKATGVDVPVVIMSGLKIAPEMQEFVNTREIEFIGKPFREEDFITTLQRSLRMRQ